MTVFRCRLSRSIQILLQGVQLALLTSTDSLVGFQLEIDDHSFFKYTHVGLLAASILAQGLLMLTVYRIDRSYDHRNQVHNEQFTFTYRAFSLQTLLFAPNELNEHMSRDHWKERYFLITFAFDFLFRITRMVLVGFWQVSSWRYFFLVLLLEQGLYFLGQLHYSLMLMCDQGYLRSLMISMDAITKRKRAVGYAEVYSCGYTFSALPGMMIMSVLFAHVLLSLIPTLIVLVLGMVNIVRRNDEVENGASAESDWEVNRWNFFLLGWMWQLSVVSMVPAVFWLEDNPSSKAVYVFSFLLVMLLAVMGFAYYWLGVVFWFPALTAPCWFYNWGDDAITYTIFCNAMLFMLSLGLSQLVFICTPEYHLRNGEQRHAWGGLLNVASPMALKSSTEFCVRQLFGSFSQSVLSSVVINVLLEPWVFLCMCQLGNSFPLWLYCLWCAAFLWGLLVTARSAKLGLQLPELKDNIDRGTKIADFEVEKLSLIATQGSLSVASITGLALQTQSSGQRWVWSLLLLLLALLRLLLSLSQIWWEFGDHSCIIWKTLFPSDAYTQDADIVVLLESAGSRNSQHPTCNFLQMRRWIKICEREIVRVRRVEDVLQRYPYPLCQLTRDELTVCLRRGRLQQIHGALGLRRLQELIYEDRRMLLLLAFSHQSDQSTRKVGGMSGIISKQRRNNAHPESIVSRVKDHNQYLIRIIASYL